MEEERGAVLLQRVERAQAEILHGERDQAEGQRHQGPADEVGVLGALAEAEDELGNRQTQGKEADGGRQQAVTASRIARVVSSATPAGRGPAASREAAGSMAVASETVISECGRIHTAYAL